MLMIGMSQQKIINLLVIHHDELVNYINARFGNRSFAVEVIQETCLRLLTKQNYDFDQVVSPLILLKRMSLHLAIDLYRKEQTSQRFFDTSLDWSELIESPQDEPLTLPELSLAKHQYEQLLIQVIKDLPIACQDVFILTQLYHLTQVEAAKQLGISRGMVNKHLASALQHLAPILFEQKL